MSDRELFEGWYRTLHAQAVDHPAWRALHDDPTPAAARELVARICRTHLRSPQVLAFLFSVAPPSRAASVQENLLEELGARGDPHPELLRRLARAAGHDDAAIAALECDANELLRERAAEPLLLGTLRELGLSVMVEVFAFEWFLSHEAGRLGSLVRTALDLPDHDLAWFLHHAEIDAGHAAEGLDTLVAHASHHGLDRDAVRSIGELTFRENPFLKQYLGLRVGSGI